MAPRHRSSKKPPPPRRSKRPSAAGDDPFFEEGPKRRRRGGAARDEDIESGDIDDDGLAMGVGVDREEEGVERGQDDEGEEEETAGERKLRMAKQYLARIEEAVKRSKDEEEDDDDGDDEDVVRGKRVAEIVHKRQLKESGRQRWGMAARVLPPGQQDEFRFIVKHRQPVTAVALSKDGEKGFSASKDGVILHWDVETGKSEKYLWPSEAVLISHHAKAPLSAKRSKHVLAMAVSSDGRYLATGGLDRHIHLWDVRSRAHIQAFSGHRGPVSCLSFGPDTSELFSGSFDRSIMQWNAEDRTYMHCVYGHQGEILTMDALTKDSLLTVARDRTMRLWKISDEKQLIFRSSVSLECCCFIDDKEFLSGSDDGSLELWSIMRKKPTHIIKNVHPAFTHNAEEKVPIENETCKLESFTSAHSWVSAVATGRGSDLAASGAANGVVRLWAILPDSKGIKPLFNLQLDGFVNSLAIAKSGRFIVAGVGREPRLGRWGHVGTAQNGVAIHRLNLAEDNSEDLLAACAG